MKYVLIDTSYLMYRSYFAFSSLTFEGKPTGALYGFAKTIAHLYSQFRPDGIFFCCDLKEPTWRHQLKNDYKAGRSPIEENMVVQIPLIYEFLDALEAPVLKTPGFEADDQVFTLTRNILGSEWMSEADTDDVVHVFSADKDLYQLLQWKNVSFIKPKKPSGVDLFTSHEFIEKYDLDPQQWLDYKALVGDPSDNLKGLPGIGPKTALNLLKEWGSLYNIAQSLHWEEQFIPHFPVSSNPAMTPRVKTLFQEHKAELWETYRLSQLHWIHGLSLETKALNWTEAQKYVSSYRMTSVERMMKQLIPQQSVPLL